MRSHTEDMLLSDLESCWCEERVDMVWSKRITHSRTKEEVQGHGGGVSIRHGRAIGGSAHALTFELETRYQPGVVFIPPSYITCLGDRIACKV